MKILPNNTELGRLSFYEIYDDFFGPKCFSVKDELEHLYLVYWSGDYKEEKCSKWVYLPLTHSTLDALLRQEKPVHEAFKNSNRLKLMTVYENTATFESINDDLKLSLNLPPECFAFDSEEIQSIAQESRWDFNLKIAKKTSGNTKPTDSVVTDILDAFGDIIKDLMKESPLNVPTLFPLSASFGSFDVKLGTSNQERANVAISLLDTLLSDIESLEGRLKTIELDPYRLKSLLNIVEYNSLELTLKGKTSDSLKQPLVLSSAKLLPVIKKLQEMTLVVIDSNKVPQANKLERVIEVVKILSNRDGLTHEHLEGLTTKRQVSYYIHAAECLGFLNKNLSLTSAGEVLLQRPTQASQFEFLSDRFESSDCGWAWMKWAEVKSLRDLNEDSAEEFIKECVKGLHRGTIKRRARGLSRWVKILKQHHRSYTCQ
ncbi:DUF6575 domain-containing protein [Vibrio crassostreae]|uniref:DUF6575 domain-containing protein n=1 Tax=Vibrio splendidus TaxID=29497 RepID=UPI000C82363B|nr:DUF6575 domain-containing protein [Vibrio splendidus]CAK2701283.1 DUF6575 domain-containing protein [Vibrio crassostreae]MCC4789450.1 hypothetical protein [Vibrio splendidus]PMO00897.1 hypothetical protein BCT19_22605 [Vibrio splendidus]CAK3108079.1 DUF6575 domain-containing protein [Vibrio crassostreae]CAK3175662.1 DUF6575 domain-containing protein [Vibrio crassostreae]